MPSTTDLTDVTAVLDRLEASFGEEPVRNLLRSLALQLGEALQALDRGDAVAIAHRAAGSAGTLGFAALGQAWLALAEDADAAAGPIRDETLTALSIIAQRLGNERNGATSV